ncbi:MAG TPA: histidine kinase dimerization/phospho-acceptor domain-containing protein, partial [Chloroflexota bacterium]
MFAARARRHGARESGHSAAGPVARAMMPLSEWVIERAGSTGRRARPQGAARGPLPGDGAPVDVLATLGHELRTPLATLRATLELLADLPAVGADAETRALFPRLERSVQWLERLVDNLTT